jgi:hypothetical protein
MSSSPRRFGALLLAAALVGAACSGGDQEAAENPKQAFSDALDAFADYEGVTLVMTIEADPSDLASADTPEAAAEALVDSSLTVSAKGGTAEDSQVALAFDIAGNEDAVELRGVGGAFYLRADVRGLVDTFEGDMAEIDAAVQQASAAGFDFAQAMVDGEWIGVEGVDELAQQFGLPQPTPDAEEAAAFADRIAAVFDENARVTSEGTDDVGAHLTVTVPLSETAEELAGALQSFGGGAAGALPASGLEEVPDADIPVDVWISDGRLVQVEFDFVAIAQELGEPAPEDVDELGLRMEIDEFTGDVEAPEDFVEIDLQQILQGFFGAASPSTGGVTQPVVEVPGDREVVVPELGLACSDLEGIPSDQIEAFLEASGQPGALKKVREACPELF